MENKPVIVGVDGSPDAVRALQWAAEYARAFQAPLHALTTFEIPKIYGPYAMAGWEDPARLEEDSRNMLADTVREAVGADAHVEERVLRGHPAQVLVKASQDAQLLVVGSRGRGGFTGMLLGSVSQHAVTQARCPIVVMPHQDPAKQ